MSNPTVIRQLLVCKQPSADWEGRVCYGKKFHIGKKRCGHWIATCDKCGYPHELPINEAVTEELEDWLAGRNMTTATYNQLKAHTEQNDSLRKMLMDTKEALTEMLHDDSRFNNRITDICIAITAELERK